MESTLSTKTLRSVSLLILKSKKVYFQRGNCSQQKQKEIPCRAICFSKLVLHGRENNSDLYSLVYGSIAFLLLLSLLSFVCTNSVTVNHELFRLPGHFIARLDFPIHGRFYFRIFNSLSTILLLPT